MLTYLADIVFTKIAVLPVIMVATVITQEMPNVLTDDGNEGCGKILPGR